MKKKILLGIVFTIVAMLSFAAVVNDNSFDSDGVDTEFFTDKGGGTTAVTYRVVSETELTASVSTGKNAQGTVDDPLVIPSKVTSDKDNKEYTVIGLDSKSFQSSRNLQFIKLPDTLTTIGESAFAASNSGTPGLVSIDIPDSVSRIGLGAFSGCVYLEKVKLPRDLTEIQNTVFYNCCKLQYIEISENVMYINNQAFDKCELLETVILPESLEGMGEFVFQDCDQLRYIHIPKNVRDIQWSSTFYGSGLEYIDVSDENPYFMENNNLVLTKDGQTMVFCPVKAKNATVPEGVKYIGTNFYQYAFRCRDLVSVSLPSTLVETTNRAFGGCSSLKKIVLPNSLEVIGDSSFIDCSSLEEVVMSDSLHTIGEFAFTGCSSLKGLTLPKTIKDIGYSAFSSCSSITGMIIPYGTEKIGGNAFSNCTSLVNLEIPDTVTELGSSVFDGCENLVGARLPDGISSVGDEMFKDCKSLRTVVIPANVRTVGSDIFYHCESLRSIEFPRTFEGFSGIIGVVFYDGNGEKYTDYTLLAGKTFVQGGKDANFKTIFYESYSDNSEGYMVTFKVDGDTYYKDFLKPGEKVVLPQDPTKKKTTGTVYSFTGWNGYTDGMTVTENTVFNAEFTSSKKVQVQFIERNGNIFETREHTYGTSFSYPAGKPDGYASYGKMYAFKDWEWYSEDDVTGLMKYKAKYDRVPGYFVKFDAAGGTGSMDRIFVKAGESATLPENAFTRSGYTFGGWTDGKNTYANNGTIPASDRNTDLPLTLDAVWNGEKYRLTVNYIGPVKDGAFIAPATHTEMIAKGESFSLTPPAVNHYTASREYVSGTMPGSDVTINVYYRSDTYKIEYGTNLDGILTKVVPKTTYSYTSEYVLPVADRVTQWYSDEAKTHPVEKISKFSTGDKKFWCDVMENKATVTVKFIYSTNYQDENKVVGTMEPVVVDYGAEITFPQCGFTYEGHTFVCWYDRGYEYNPEDSRNVYTDTSFYAKWKKVEYNLSVTLAGPTESFDFGDNPTSFTGKKEWGTVELYTLGFRDITVDGKTYAPEIEKFYMPTEDTTLTVHYYEKSDSSAKKSIVYNSDLSVYLPAKNFASFATHRGTVELDDLAYDGYRFDGWYSDKERTTKIDKVDLNVSENRINVYAKWTPLEHNLKVVYTGPNDGRFQAPADHVEKVKTNVPYRIISPAVEGYAPVIKYLEGKMGPTDTTVEVQYVPTEWNIRYYTNGGDNAIDSIPDYTMTQSVTYKIPTREGYTFNGWYSDPELTVKVVGIPEGNTKFVRVYASWISESGGTVTVNFVGPDANFTAPANIERYYAAGDRYSINVPSVVGYTPDRTKVEGTMGTDDITVTVTYSANQHTVRIKTGQTDTATPAGWTKESDGVFVRTFGFASQIVLPELSREGYTFRWSPDVPTSMPDSDLEFEAVWTEMSRELVICYVGPSGDKDFPAPNEIRVNVRTGESYEYRSPTVEGYVPDKETVKGVMGDQDISVTVTYSVKKVTVTFLPNNGDLVWSVTTDYNETVAEPKAPAWDGHTFIGWFSKGVMYDFDTPVKDDINLTAEWNSESGEYFIVHTDGQVEFNIPSTGSTNTNIIIELPNNVNISFGSNTIQSAAGSNIQASMTELGGEKFEITVNKDGETMNGAPMDISLPFTPGKGTPLVYYYPDDGDRILMGGEVDNESSTIKFRTDHNSVYGIVYTTSTVPGDDNDGADPTVDANKSSSGLDRNELIAIVAATIVGALALLIIVVRRK